MTMHIHTPVFIRFSYEFLRIVWHFKTIFLSLIALTAGGKSGNGRHCRRDGVDHGYSQGTGTTVSVVEFRVSRVSVQVSGVCMEKCSGIRKQRKQELVAAS
jgi:hypothetical protein